MSGTPAIKVYTAEEALNAAIKDATKVLTIEKKKDDKAYKGTRFLNTFYNIGADVKKEGWFSVEDVPLSDGIADPENKSDKRNEFEGIRLQLQTSVSRAGAFGQFLMALNPHWRAHIDALVKAGLISAAGRRVHDLLQLALSDENKETPGAKIEDPIIRFKIDFSPFPQRYKHKFLIGQPRTQFFDYRTKYIDDRGREQFKVAMVKNADGKEELVTDKNLHLFVTPGSILRRGRLMMPSVAVSQSWISLPCIINRAVIEPGAEDGFSDEMPADINAVGTVSALRAALDQSSPSISSTPEVKPVATSTLSSTVTAEDVDEVLGSI